MYPSIEQLLAAPDKEKLFEVRRAFRSNLIPFIILALSVAAVIAMTLSFEGGVFPASIPFLGERSVRWLGLIPAVILLEILRRYHDDLYVFGSERVTHYEGRLSLSSSVPSLKYSDIKAIMVEQNIVERMFNYGNVLLDSAAQDGAELTVSGVIAPLSLAYVIEDLRRISNKVAAQSNEPAAITSNNDA